jgi:hypothetical protein
MVLVFLPMEPRWLRLGAPLVEPICNLQSVINLRLKQLQLPAWMQ